MSASDRPTAAGLAGCEGPACCKELHGGLMGLAQGRDQQGPRERVPTRKAQNLQHAAQLSIAELIRPQLL